MRVGASTGGCHSENATSSSTTTPDLFEGLPDRGSDVRPRPPRHRLGGRPARPCHRERPTHLRMIHDRDAASAALRSRGRLRAAARPCRPTGREESGAITPSLYDATRSPMAARRRAFPRGRTAGRSAIPPRRARAPVHAGAVKPQPAAITSPPRKAPRLFPMLRAEWFIAAAIDWLSSATSISRVWIVGLSTDDTKPTTKTQQPERHDPEGQDREQAEDDDEGRASPEQQRAAQVDVCEVAADEVLPRSCRAPSAPGRSAPPSPATRRPRSREARCSCRRRRNHRNRSHRCRA